MTAGRMPSYPIRILTLWGALAAATVDDVFDPEPETLVDRLRQRRAEAGG